MNASRGALLFGGLLLSDISVIIMMRHDWSPTALALASRLALLAGRDGTRQLGRSVRRKCGVHRLFLDMGETQLSAFRRSRFFWTLRQKQESERHIKVSENDAARTYMEAASLRWGSGVE